MIETLQTKAKNQIGGVGNGPSVKNIRSSMKLVKLLVYDNHNVQS